MTGGAGVFTRGQLVSWRKGIKASILEGWLQQQPQQPQ
jgi:hypothetical protein